MASAMDSQQQHHTRPRQGSATEKFYYPTPRRRRGNSTTNSVMTSDMGNSAQQSQSRPFPLTPPRRRKKTVMEPPVVLNHVVHNMTSLERLRMMTQSLNTAASAADFVPPPQPSSSSSTYSTSPSTRSNGGYGHQFTVANVGSNGMLYLRPVTRQNQDPFVIPPTTPPQTAERHTLPDVEELQDESRVTTSLPPKVSTIKTQTASFPLENPKTPPSSPKWQAPLQAPPSSPPIPKVTQHRARSFSIVGDHVKPSHDGPEEIESHSLAGKTEPPPRPRTAGPPGYPTHLLDISIPRGTLGAPSFTPSGTPFIHGSSLPPNSTTVERRVSSTWNMYNDFRIPWISGENRKRPPLASAPSNSLNNSALPSPIFQSSEPIMTGGLQSIVPTIFDILTFSPSCDEASIVRYDPRTHEVTAATPPRMIAQITSAAFLDYQFMSEFFLTFRAFMTPNDLVSYLMARLRWAIDRGDEIGKVVRVRTFVAIRHWLLNYFADDFVPSLELRENFASLLNDLSDDVYLRLGQDKSNMNILAELKKCWRKAAVLYWDGIPGGVYDEEVRINSHITPGGEAGTRDDPKSLKAAFEEDWSRRKGKGRARDSKSSIRRLPDSSLASGATQRLIRDIITAGNEKSVHDNTSKGIYDSNKYQRISSFSKVRPMSDSSSLHAYNYSGHENSHSKQVNHTMPSGPFNPFLPKMTTFTPSQNKGWKPLLHSGKKMEKIQSHKRSGSHNDSRQNWNPAKAPKFLQGTSPHLVNNNPFAGDLVRGNLVAPTTAVVEMVAPATPTEKSLADIKIQNHKFGQHHRIAALSGPSVRKLFGNVKRVLSGRASSVEKNPSRPTHLSGPSEALAKYVADNGRNATLTGILSRTGSLASESVSASTRIDLLGAGVVEAFHKALAEELKIPEHGFESEKMASQLTITIGKAVTTAQDSPRSTIGMERNDYFDQDIEVIIGMSDGMDRLSLTPKEMPRRRFLRSRSSGVVLESKRNTLKRTQSGRVAVDDWNNKGVVTPSPSTSDGVRRSQSFSFEPSSVRASQVTSNYEIGHAYKSSLDSYDSTATGRFAPRAYSRNNFTEPMDEEEEDESALSSPLSKSLSSPFGRPPARMLRRRPGGDLKDAKSIGELGNHARQQSEVTVETLETFSDSTMSIWQKHPESGMYPPNLGHGVLSLGAMTMGGYVKTIPVQNEHQDEQSDEEDADASEGEDDEEPETFEAGVLKLAELSDAASDDGGIEVALAKLEGTYNRKQLEQALSLHQAQEEQEAAERAKDQAHSTPKIRVEEQEVLDSDLSEDENNEDDSNDEADDSDNDEAYHDDDNDDDDEDESDNEDRSGSETCTHPRESMPVVEKRKRRQRQVVDQNTFTPLPSSGGGGLMVDEKSFSSFPFGLQAATVSSLNIVGLNTVNGAQPELERGLSVDSPMLSIPNTVGNLTLSLEDIQKEFNEGRSEANAQISALEFGQDAISDLSSEISYDILSQSKQPRPVSISSSVLPGLQPSTLLAEAGVPSHPLRHPPSPPLTLDRTTTVSTTSGNLPTVDMSTIIPPDTTTDPLSLTRTKSSTNKLRKGVSGSGVHATAIHLPFILAYDSELLAKQFTLIEKDALTEIDWKELIELRWKPTSKPFRDWVDFLKNNEVRGVEIVVARFNLMVSWATSEIVMTRDIQERARCITKYIHVAAHARRLQNFATTYQIVVALLSQDVARLRKTWQLIAEADLVTFKDLESLVQPNMNYHNLRREMDLVTGETGCIPFVGLFTHDLIHTATMTSQVAGTINGPALVNWTKYKRTAQIVKKLLRLVDASGKYDFQPVDGVCERCLWMATLTKDEISTLSLEIEPSEFR